MANISDCESTGQPGRCPDAAGDPQQANAKVADNQGFTVDDTPWMSADERRKKAQQKKT